MSIFLLSDTNQLNNELKEKIASEVKKRGNKVAYISSEPQDQDRKWFHNSEQEYKDIAQDINLEYFDLSANFSDESLRTVLNFGTIHLSGGNTYSFLDQLRKRNFKSILEEHLSKNGLVVGVSAGAIVLTPHIDTTSMCGDSNSIGLQDLTGMDFVDFGFLPHLGTHYLDTPENHAQLEELSRKLGMRIYIGADPGGIFMDAAGPQMLGDVLLVGA